MDGIDLFGGNQYLRYVILQVVVANLGFDILFDLVLLINGFGDRYSTLELCFQKREAVRNTASYGCEKLFHDLQDLTGTYRTATLADCETQTSLIATG